MNDGFFLPRILIIDDLFGRTHPDQRNEERSNLCGQYLIEDVTGDEVSKGTALKIKRSVAHAVFYRGQTPTCSTVGDTVENDLKGSLQMIREGWLEWQPDKPRWTMVLLDLCFYTGRVTEQSNWQTLGMPEGRDGDDNPRSYFGLRILEAIHDEFPDLPVLILSSRSREEVSLEFSQLGALGFLPRDAEDSPDSLRKYIWRHGLIPGDTGEVVGHSKAFLLALRAARRAASNRRNLLLQGERGTGKEVLARYIHRKSTVEGEPPLIVVDSGALSPHLYASELFGHKRGAFTGADREREGRILQADGGDLFLDEIGNMPPDVQIGLLRVLESREVMPLGATTGQSVDVRFLSATNENIEEKAFTGGGFRLDLLDRLREGGAVFLPPLRERVEDIPLLVEKFVRDAESANPNALRRQIDSEALDMLCTYDWPGNVRELRNCIFSAVNTHPDVEHLVPVHIQFSDGRRTADKPLEVAQTALSQTSTGSDLEGLVSALDAFTFESAKLAQLAGRLPKLQGAYARLIARYLKAVLEATRRPTLENPDGEIFIHPAIKQLTGDPKISASKAADIIKRLLGLYPEAIEPLLADPTLKEAHETALRLRPRGAKSKK